MDESGGSHRMSRRGIATCALFLCGGVAAGALMALVLPRTHTTATTAAAVGSQTFARQPAPGFALTDQAGAPVSLSSARGHVVLLTFMDPQCTQLCPVMGRDVGAVERRLPAGIHPELLIVSVAPGRTSADVQGFLNREAPGWLPGWHWLLGPNRTALELAWSRWQVSVSPAARDVNHDAVLDVIDPQGYLRAAFPAPLLVDDVVHAISTVAHA